MGILSLIKNKIYNIIIYLQKKFVTIIPGRLFRIAREKLFEYELRKNNITKEDIIEIEKRYRLFEKSVKASIEEKWDYFVLYNDVRIKNNINDNDKEKFRFDISGIARNYHGKEESFALLTHGNEHGKLLYAEGLRIGSADGDKTLKDYDFSKLTTPEEFVDLLKERQGIDLRKGGNTGDDPLYLISCHALKGGNDSAAQQLAYYTKRDIFAHSESVILSQDIRKIGNYNFRKKTPVMRYPGNIPSALINQELEEIRNKNREKKRINPKKHKNRDINKLSKVRVFSAIESKKYHSKKFS